MVSAGCRRRYDRHGTGGSSRSQNLVDRCPVPGIHRPCESHYHGRARGRLAMRLNAFAPLLAKDSGSPVALEGN